MFLSLVLFSLFFGSSVFAAETATACTMEYAPVCGEVQVQCITAPCPPMRQTFSNRCMLDANTLAKFVAEGECEKEDFSCPQYAPPAPWFCSDGQIVDGGTDENWCQRHPTCQKSIGMANPASVNCEAKGGKLEIRTNAEGGQYGECLFSDGSSCEERAFFRGECSPKQTNTDPVDGELSWCASYFDGCNTCTVKNGKPDACTMMFCEKPAKPYCKQKVSANEWTADQINTDLSTCASYFDGCNTCTVTNGKIGGCTKMHCNVQEKPYCKQRVATEVDLSAVIIQAKLTPLIKKVLAKRPTDQQKDILSAKISEVVQQKINTLQIIWRALTAGEEKQILVLEILKKILLQEQKLRCETRKGVREQVGRAQTFQCNEKTADAGKSCTANDQCTTLCLAPGKCAPTTVNFGCFDVMQQGKQATLCVD